MFRPTWAEISLDAIAANTRALLRLAAPADLLAVVKADAYGHGAVETSRTVLEAGATWLGIAALEEAIELRRAGITAPILNLSPSMPAQADTIVGNDVVAAVFDLETAEALAAAGRRHGRPARAHLKVDTGMGRMGVTPDQAGADFALRLSRLEGLELEGVYTHFSSSDEADPTFTRQQAALFEGFLALCAKAGLKFRWRHAANTAGIISHPETRQNLVRVGIGLYGLYPSAEVDPSRVALVPAMTWKSRLLFVKRVAAGTPVSYNREFITERPTVIGTLPVGYADGYRRANTRGRVLVRGASCPVLGRVCMDHIMVGLDAVVGLAVGDSAAGLGANSVLDSLVGEEAILLGGGPSASLSAEELAATCQTINYEIVSSVGRRVPRVFIRGGRPVAIRSILGTAPLGGAALPGGGPK